MSYQRRVFENRVPVYMEKRISSGNPSMFDDVVIPSLFAWALFMAGSLGLSFTLVSARLVPTNDDILTMIGIALGVSAISTLFPFGVLLDRFNARLWSEEIEEYEPSSEIDDGSNLWQQTGPRTISRTRHKYSHIILHDLALNCFNTDGTWKEETHVRREPFEGIGITSVERKYRDKILQDDFERLGWMIEIESGKYRWTEHGKRELYKYFPPIAHE